MIKADVDDQRMKQCTFSPSTLNPADKPNFPAFLKNQDDFLSRKEARINKMKEDIEKEKEDEIGVPIGKREITKGPNDGSIPEVYDRL